MWAFSQQFILILAMESPLVAPLSTKVSSDSNGIGSVDCDFFSSMESNARLLRDRQEV